MKPLSSDISDLSSFLLSNRCLLALTGLAYLTVGLAGSLFPRLVHSRFDRFRALKLALFRMPFLNLNQIFFVSSKFGILVLSLTFFLFFMRNFLSGTIKVSFSPNDSA